MPVKVFTALVVQDVQNDYMRTVADAETILAPISEMAQTFERVILAQDFKPEDHVSFAGGQKLCVEGTAGADMPSTLRLPMSRMIAILKGTRKDIDSYSAFLDADRKTETGLKSYCDDRFVNRLYICGLNVHNGLVRTALDALHYGLEVYWVTDAVAGFDDNNRTAMVHKNLHFITKAEVLVREIA